MLQFYHDDTKAVIETSYLASGGFKDIVLNSQGGNLGLGVTPSAWGSFTGMQIGTLGGLSLAGTTDNVFLGSNVYFGSGAFRYAATGYVASNYRQTGGYHYWFTTGTTTGTAGTTASFTQAMTLDSNGLLGIGQTSPISYVDVYGSGAYTYARFWRSDEAGYGGRVGTGNTLYGAATTRSLGLDGFTSISLGIAGIEKVRIDSSGNLLVGATTTGIPNGGIQLNPAGNGAGKPFIGSGGNTSSDGDVTNAVYSTSLSQYQFYVGYAGTVFARSIVISSLSDQRLKENIVDLDVGLDKIMALKPRKFDWKEGKGTNKKNVRGFIAQELEQVFPDLIDEWRDPAPEGEAPYKSVRQDLMPVLVKAIQEQQTIIESLKARLDAANL
jgi:hypothetical protein